MTSMKLASPSPRPFAQFHPKNSLPDFTSLRQEAQFPPLERNGSPTWNDVTSFLSSFNATGTQLSHSKEEPSERVQFDTESQMSKTNNFPRRENPANLLEYSLPGISHYFPVEFPQQFHSSPLSSPPTPHYEESSDGEQSEKLKRQQTISHSSLSSPENRTTRISDEQKRESDNPVNTGSQGFNLVPSFPQVAINNINLGRLIFDGTNELFVQNSRKLLFSALHGMMGYVHPWNRPLTKNKSWPTKRDVLITNRRLLRDHSIDIFNQNHLELLVTDSGGPLNGEFVYLVAARLAMSEGRIKLERAKALQRAVFEFVTGHRGYREAIEGADRRIIYDDGRVKFDVDEGVF